MSIKDSTNTARSFSQVSQSGYDQTFVCSNPPTDHQIKISDKQTRPSKAGSIASVLSQVQVTYTDPTTGVIEDVIVNFTVKTKNTTPGSALRVKDAVVLALRRYNPTDAGTNIETTLAANVVGLAVGILPAP